MAVNQGPQISRTGLVAYYDASNESSFRGLPTTNLMYSVGYSWGNGANDPFLKVVNGRESAFIPYFNRNVDVTFVDIYNDYSGGSNACCPAPMFFGNVGSAVNVSGNTTYMYQLIFKTDTGYYHPNYMYRYEYGASGYIAEGGLVNASRLESLGDGWFHAWGQFTTNASTTFLNCYLFHYDYATWNRIRVAAVSLTQGTTIHRPEHILNFSGTRGSTVATGGGWKSLVGSHDAELVNGVSFDSSNGGSLVFDGVNDYINLATNIQSGFTAATYEFFCRPTSLPTSGNYFQLYIQESSTWIALYNVGLGSFFGIDLGNGTGWFDNNGGVATGAVTNTVLSTNTWYHLVFSWNGSSVSIYLNGILQNTASTNQAVNGRQNVNVLGPGTTNRSIGSRYLGGGNNFVGNMAAIKFYNRAMSAAEVLTNYNSFKGRLNTTVNRTIVLTRPTFNSLGSSSLFNSTILFLDPGNKLSFTQGNRFWYDISTQRRRVTLYSNGGSTYRLSASAAPTWSSDGKGSFVFDGTNDFGRLDTELTTTANFTVSVWVKTTASGDRGIFSHCSGGPVYMGYSVETYMKYWYYSGQWQTLTGNTIVNDGTWKNLVWVTAGLNLKMYVNGVLDRDVSLIASLTAIMRSIGSLWGPCNTDSGGVANDSYGSVFSGSMGPLIVWNRALSPTEVVQLYDNFKSRFAVPYIPTNGLQLYLDAANRASYPGTGLTWFDISGNNRHFTIESAFSWNSAGYFSMNESGGIYWSGSLSSATTCTVIVWMRTKDIRGLYLHGQDGTYYVGAYYDQNKEYYGNSGGNFIQDTVDRANIYDFAIDGNWHMKEFKSVNLSTWTFFQFNRYGSGYSFYHGSVAAIMIYNRNLSTAESQMIYNTMRTRFTNAATVVTTGLVLYIDAGDGSSYPQTGTTLTDLSGKGYSAVINNGGSFGTPNGGYILMDGVNDYILSSSTSLGSQFTTNVVSHFIWVYPTAAGQIVSELGTTVPSDSWHDTNIEVSSSGAFSFSTWHGSLTNRVVSSNRTLSRWYYVGFTYDGTTLTAYINGVIVGTTTFSRSAPYLNGFGLYYGLFAQDSTNMGTLGYAAGRFGSFKVYNRSLSRFDVLQNYKATRARFGLEPITDGLLLHLDAGDVTSYRGNGNLWYDLSGNSKNGTLTNGPTFNSADGGSIVFDAVNDSVVTTLTGVINTMTVECWFKGTNTARNHLWNFGSYGDNSNLNFNLNDSGYDLWVYWEGNGSNRVRYNIDGSFTDSTIKHVVFTHTGSTNKVYLNGTELTITESGGTQTFTNVNLSNYFLLGDFSFGGNIYIVRVYNRALTAEEVTLNYNAERWRFVP